MVKMNPILIGVIVIGLFFILNQQTDIGTQAILPPGEFRSNADCTFLTNIIEEPGFFYREGSGWIAVDPGTGIKGFGFGGFSGLNCGDPGTTILSATTPEGFALCTRSSHGDTRIYIDSPGKPFFEDDRPTADGAILECGQCIPDSSCAGNTCVGSTCVGSCGNIHDGTVDCGACPTMQELVGCRDVTRGDLGMAINSWIG